MPEVTTYAPGTPCWVDLSTADVERAVGFYNAVLGWEPASAEEAEEIGGLVACRIRGLNVAAIAALGDTNQPPGWTTYIATADAEATCARVQDAGGEVLLDPGDVGMMGRLSVCADPQQAVFGLWQPGEVAGRAARRRARREHLGRPHHIGPRGRPGVLRGRLRLARRPDDDRRRALHDLRARAGRAADHGDRRGASGHAAALGRLLRRTRRRRGDGDRGRVRRGDPDGARGRASSAASSR
jgi:predicted enzyme related to lactoylglutathione lyase